MFITNIANSQGTFNISGYVTNLNGGAIQNQPVYLKAVTNTNTSIINAYTNLNGFYSFQNILPPSLGTVTFYEVYTFDCNGTKDSSIVQIVNSPVTVNFSICSANSSLCSAYFAYNLNSTISNIINFTDISSGNPISWHWDFGDGTTSTLQNPVHNYNSNGMYYVCLTITNSNFCTSIFCDTVIVGNNSNSCLSNFTYYIDTLPSQFNVVHFYNTSSIPYPSNQVIYQWNFGDGTTSNLENPLHTYQTNPNSINVFNVCLTIKVISGLGTILCQNTNCNIVTLPNNSTYCQNTFTYSNQGLTYTFTGYVNTSLPTSFFWNFGDGTTDTGQIVTHTYSNNPAPSNGYNVCLNTTSLVVNSGSICQSSSCTFVNLNNNIVNVIQGYVYAGNLPVNNGYVLIYKINQSNTSYVLVDSIPTNSNGFYQHILLNPQSGSPQFLIKANICSSSSIYNQFAPTYYFNSVNWYFAVPVLLSNFNTFYNINMIPLISPVVGNGNISGNVVSLNSIKSSNDIPLSKVELYLTDENDLPLKFSYSDNNGNFYFNSLPLGTYKLYLNIPGVVCNPYSIILNSSNPTVSNINISISNNFAIITSIEKNKNYENFIGEIFPNPTNDEAFIEFNSNSSQIVKVEVIDTKGLIVSSNEYYIEGYRKINLAKNDLKSGIYTIKIYNSDRSSIIKKLVITK